MSTQVYNERIMLKNVYGMRRVFILSALCILIVLSCFQLGGRAQAQEEYRKNYGDAVDFGFKPINVHGCVGRTSPILLTRAGMVLWVIVNIYWVTQEHSILLMEPTYTMRPA